jgi:hypothetical protein
VARSFVGPLLLAFVSASVIAQNRPGPHPRPDIVPQKNATLAGKAVAWGRVVDLGTMPQVQGRCSVLLNYSVVEQGGSITTPYVHRFRIGNTVIGTLAIAPTLPRRTNFTARLLLPAGRNLLTMKVDDENKVIESDEANNSVGLTYTARCGSVDIAASGNVQVSDRNTPWNGGQITLKAGKASGKRRGQCRFPVFFDIVNRGALPATAPFVVKIVENEVDVFTGTVPQLAPGATTKLSGQVWLRCCAPQKRTAVMWIDAEKRLDDGDRTTNRYELPYQITGGDCR